MNYLKAISPVTMGLDGRISFASAPGPATKPNHAGRPAPTTLAALLLPALVQVAILLRQSLS